LDSSLVSNKLEQNTVILRLGPGPGNLSKNCQNLPHVRHLSLKARNSKPEVFFHCRLEDLPSLLRVWAAL